MEDFDKRATFKYQSGIVIAASQGPEALKEEPTRINFFEPNRGTNYYPKG